jgi:hypothetical protein
MELSPRRSRLHRKLYRNGMFAVTLAALILLGSPWLAAQGPIVQYGRKPAADKGPRALGLIHLSPKGDKGRLIPIAIMMDGKFYDAGSYKGAPVPMALDFDTVYEGLRTGVSEGVFTITQPGQLNHVWIAEGTWLPAGMKAPEKSKKYEAPVIEDKDADAPPVLHRHSDADAENKDKGKDKDKGQQKPPIASTPPAPDKPTAPDTAKPPAPADTAKAPADEPISDPNRPRLRRGQHNPTAHREPFTTFDEEIDAKPAGASPDAKATKDSTASPQVAMIPAISDAGGPDPRPYTYDMKPAEEASYRSKMLELAAQLRAKDASGTKAPAPTRKKSSVKSATPDMDDVTLRVFDLSSSNEPVLVLSAKTHPSAVTTGSIEEPQEITLIARTNLEGELKKLFFSQTDSRHLYAAPRMELIDAVDADGDGRGELLFRRTSDNGSAYAIYRVTADGLWPLYEGTP